MKKISLTLLIIFFSSCSLKTSKVEKLVIDFFKGETLDPEQFELIMIETSELTERDLEISEIKESLKDEKKKVEWWRILEKFKADPENGNIYGVSNYSVVYGDSFDGTRKSLRTYQSEYNKNPRSSYTRKLRERLLSDVDFVQSLFCSSPEEGQKAIEEYEQSINLLNNDKSDSPISRYDVKLRFYAMNRLGTRGITDVAIEVYLDEEGNLVLGFPEYGEL